jgi:hypothetical protein
MRAPVPVRLLLLAMVCLVVTACGAGLLRRVGEAVTGWEPFS